MLAAFTLIKKEEITLNLLPPAPNLAILITLLLLKKHYNFIRAKNLSQKKLSQKSLGPKHLLIVTLYGLRLKAFKTFKNLLFSLNTGFATTSTLKITTLLTTPKILNCYKATRTKIEFY